MAFICLLRIIRLPVVRVFVLAIAAIFLSPNFVFAQSTAYAGLPQPGSLLAESKVSSCPSFTGIRFDPDNPLKLTFLADSAGENFISKDESSRLIYYFLAGLTLPEDELWVNLSPYEQDRIAGDNLAATDLGCDMLAQDYILKQLAASLTYPESSGGKEYWSDVYDSVFKKLGTTNIAVNSFNKVWIIPGSIALLEKGNVAYIDSADLKVMTDFDFNAAKKNRSDTTDPTAEITANALREKLIPVITREVNQGGRFARLRQIYRSLILAVWFKKKFKESFYKSYIGQAKVKGIDLAEKGSREKIFSLYVEAFKKGSYDYIRHDYDKHINKHLRRRYYSGGVDLGDGAIRDAVMATSAVARQNFALKGKLPSMPKRSLGGRPIEVVAALDAVGAGVEASGAANDLDAFAATPIAVALDPFELDEATLANREVLNELRMYKERRRQVSERFGTTLRSPLDRIFVVRTTLAIAWRNKTQPRLKLGPDQYELTPYMREWLKSASLEQLADIVKDTGFMNPENPLWKKLGWGSQADRNFAHNFGVYFWLCTLAALKSRVGQVGANRKVIGREGIEGLLRAKDAVSDTVAEAKGRLTEAGLDIMEDFPADLTEAGKYRFFVGGQGLVLLGNDVDENGLSYQLKLTLPQPGHCAPSMFSNQSAAREGRIVKKNNVIQTPNVPRLVAGFVAPNGSVGTVCRVKPGLDALDESPHLKALKKEGKIRERILILLNGFTQVVETIAHANDYGIVHRDIKPGNIFIGTKGQTEVGDWGIATDRQAERDDAGTPTFSAPEVLFQPVFTVAELSRLPELSGVSQGLIDNAVLAANNAIEKFMKGRPDKVNRLQVALPFTATEFIDILDEPYKQDLKRNAVYLALMRFRLTQYTRWRKIKDAPTRDSYGVGATMEVMLGDKWGDQPQMREAYTIMKNVIADLKKQDPYERMRLSDPSIQTRMIEAINLLSKAIFLQPTRQKGSLPPIPKTAQTTAVIADDSTGDQGDNIPLLSPEAVDMVALADTQVSESGGIDFDYANFDIKVDNKTSKGRYAGAEYKGIILKGVATRNISPSTSLAAWAAGK